MGEIADAMISGLFCQGCGVLVDGDEPGYPRWCDDCAGGEYAEERAKRSEETFGAAKRMAAWNKMQLRMPSEGCYQLKCLVNGWIVNLYPRRKGNSPRAYHDPNHKGPFLPLPEQWTLLDAVRSAVATWRHEEGAK